MRPTLPELGRGRPEHKYLQHLIKRLAEERGFRGTLEDAAGSGQVDLALRRDDLAIAVEVTVTTDIEHEIRTIEKCLTGGFQRVLLVCTDSRRAARYRKPIADRAFGSEVTVLEPEALADYFALFEAPAEAPDTVVRGYKVRVSRQAFTPEEAPERRQTIAKTIARSVGRQK